MLVMVSLWTSSVPLGTVPKSWTNTAGGLSFWKNLFAHGTNGAGDWADPAAAAAKSTPHAANRTDHVIRVASRCTAVLRTVYPVHSTAGGCPVCHRPRGRAG